jgi:type IV secretory pathway TrbF-like protein
VPNFAELTRKDVTIASGAATSGAFEWKGTTLGLILGTITGATFTFTASDTETGTYVAVVDDAGNAISITATDDSAVGITGTDLAALQPFRWLKIVSASNEAAERTIVVVSKDW